MRVLPWNRQVGCSNGGPNPLKAGHLARLPDGCVKLAVTVPSCGHVHHCLVLYVCVWSPMSTPFFSPKAIQCTIVHALFYKHAFHLLSFILIQLMNCS